MDKWEYSICGYIHDPEIGDADHNVSAGTPFEQLPKNRVCPVCGTARDQFVKRQ